MADKYDGPDLQIKVIGQSIWNLAVKVEHVDFPPDLPPEKLKEGLRIIDDWEMSEEHDSVDLFLKLFHLLKPKPESV